MNRRKSMRPLLTAGLIAGALLVAALLVWQGVTAQGNPDPTTPHISTPVAVLDIAALVFREGLECVLVLSAITASLMGSHQAYRRPIGLGAGVGFIATLIPGLLLFPLLIAWSIVFRLFLFRRGQDCWR